ncbi:MAG: hypothetical protein A2176_10030 [Spirochaetes bacterium RBG_13_51_14]|nr:MAG: hypothetical protein A2176_10030 [Spirochaetes bacterium RBG_13_51_14]
MKKTAIGILFIFIVMAASCDDDDKKLLLPKKGNAPEDVVNDETDTGEFKYQTIHDVTFDIQVYDETNRPLPQTVIRVTSEEGDITMAVTADNGTVSFKISIANTVEMVSLVLEHPDCITKTVDIANIQSISTVNRSIYLELKPDKKPKPDRDSDGVPDDADEFPDDPFLIGTSSGEFTIAFEDLYPQKGDADFNDLVVKLNFKEFIDNNNMISKIVIKSKMLAAGAGYTNQLWICVLDKDYQLIANSKTDLNGKFNSKQGETYQEALEHTQEIVPDSPAPRDRLEAMPYDPYILCNGVPANQVHLPFVKTKFAGKVLDTDNFPWAVLVPADWAWPYEKISIFTAYPEFKPWYESKGAEYKDWYLHPEVDKVFKVSAGTALTAYLMKVSANLNIGIVLGILTALLLVIVGINYWRKHQKSA